MKETETTVSLANLAIQSAKERFGKSLSFSKNSLSDLEDMLNYAISQIDKYKAENKPIDKMIKLTSKIWGNYLGEVMYREFGGFWLISEPENLVLLVDGVEIEPVTYITERLTNQTPYTAPQFFSAVKEKIDLSRKNRPKTTYMDIPPTSNFARTRISDSTISIGQIIIHLILIFITGGVWLLVLIVWALVSLINRR